MAPNSSSMCRAYRRFVVSEVKTEVVQDAVRAVAGQFAVELPSRSVLVKEEARDEARTASGPYLLHETSVPKRRTKAKVPELHESPSSAYRTLLIIVSVLLFAHNYFCS